MRKPAPEVLAPAGDRAALDAAVRGGADAVYFGLHGFNARARAIASILVAAVQGAFQLGGAAPGAIAPGSMAPLLRRTAAGLLDLEPRRR